MRRAEVVQRTLPLFVLAAFIQSCETEKENPLAVPAVSNQSSISPAGIARGSRGVEDRFLTIEARIPGFGGVFLNSDGNLQAYVKDLDRATDALSEIRAVLHEPLYYWNDDGSRREVVVVQGDYSMSELITWKEGLARRLGGHREVVFFDADEGRNRVRVGVSSKATEPVVLQAARDGDVPLDAVVFEEAEPAVTQSNPHHGAPPMSTDLTDKVRPPTGGFEIHVDSTLNLDCTLGFNVHDDSENRFHLTAGHCTNNFAGPTGVLSYQASYSDTIAEETNNPAWQTSGCEEDVCNVADAALFEYVIPTGTWPGNFVAITTDIGTGPGNSGTTVDFLAPITDYEDPLQYQTVYKTGKTTGTTVGYIQGTCVDQALWDGPSQQSILVPCSLHTNLYTSQGDSGAPVFSWKSLWFEVFYAIGIHSGSGIVSSWDQLEEHFGFALYPEAPTLPMSVDISGPSLVREDDTCIWSASVSGGGQSPYQYAWLLDWEEAEETSSSIELYIEPDWEYFTLVAMVRDSLGHIAGDTLEVDVAGPGQAPPCGL